MWKKQILLEPLEWDSRIFTNTKVLFVSNMLKEAIKADDLVLLNLNFWTSLLKDWVDEKTINDRLTF